MRTVGTKLDNSEYEIFEYVCSENGLTKSEQLRDLIKTFIGDVDEPCAKDKRSSAEGKIIAINGNPVAEIINPEIVY